MASIALNIENTRSRQTPTVRVADCYIYFSKAAEKKLALDDKTYLCFYHEEKYKDEFTLEFNNEKGFPLKKKNNKNKKPYYNYVVTSKELCRLIRKLTGKKIFYVHSFENGKYTLKPLQKWQH